VRRAVPESERQRIRAARQVELLGAVHEHRPASGHLRCDLARDAALLGERRRSFCDLVRQRDVEAWPADAERQHCDEHGRHRNQPPRATWTLVAGADESCDQRLQREVELVERDAGEEGQAREQREQVAVRLVVRQAEGDDAEVIDRERDHQALYRLAAMADEEQRVERHAGETDHHQPGLTRTRHVDRIENLQHPCAEGLAGERGLATRERGQHDLAVGDTERAVPREVGARGCQRADSAERDASCAREALLALAQRRGEDPEPREHADLPVEKRDPADQAGRRASTSHGRRAVLPPRRRCPSAAWAAARSPAGSRAARSRGSTACRAGRRHTSRRAGDGGSRTAAGLRAR